VKTMSDKRDELRQRILAMRQQLNSVRVDEASQMVVKRLYELEPVKKARSIMIYNSIKNEINLDAFLLQKDRDILLPHINREGLLEAIKFTGWENMVQTAMGIYEPIGPPYPLKNIDVVLVPGLVFDGNGYRLGYGRGYYDRFLCRLNKHTFICGICFDFQVVNTVYPQAHDVRMDWIVTERSELVLDWSYF